MTRYCSRACILLSLLALACVLVNAAEDLGAPIRSADSVLPSLPKWAQNGSMDFILDFKSVDPNANKDQDPKVATYRGKAVKISKDYGTYYGNVAIVRYGTELIAAIRKIRFYVTWPKEIDSYPPNPKGRNYISVWQSWILLCTVDPNTMQPTSCRDYDPRTFEECLWQEGFEGTGVEDPRLIVWPGKGLYMQFGSKPMQKKPGEDLSCEGPWQFQPWLVLLRPYVANALTLKDPWVTDKVVRLSHLPAGHHTEKNWAAFIHKDQLYFSQSFDPHVVLKAQPDGTCVEAFSTSSSRAFGELAAKPRGNTNAVFVPSALSGEDRDYYLGIVHSEVNRTYENYFYKMQARPPFRIMQISVDIPLVFGPHPRVDKWQRVSFPLSLDLLADQGLVILGYGSGDRVPHVKMLTLREIQSLFAARGGSTAAQLHGETRKLPKQSWAVKHLFDGGHSTHDDTD